MSQTTERALAFFTARADAAPGTKRELVRDREAILSTLALGAAEARWSEVLRLARAAEPAFMLSVRWGAWDEILDYELHAARALGDAKAEAWALHQRGSRALALGNASLATEALTDALRIRDRLGDVDGAAVTRHNLSLLGPTAPAKRRWRSRRVPIIAGAIVLLAAGSLAAYEWNRRSAPVVQPIAMDSLAAPKPVVPVAPVSANSTVVAHQDTTRPTQPSAPVVATRRISDSSSGAVAAPSAPAPLMPAQSASLVCDADSKQAVRIAWHRVAVGRGATSPRYELEVRNASGAAAPATTMSDTTGSVPLPCGADYDWRVRTVSSAAEKSGWTPWWRFTIQPPRAAPSPVTPMPAQPTPLPTPSQPTPVQPTPAQPPQSLGEIIDSIQVSPRSIVAGETVKLCWNASGAVSRVRIDPNVGEFEELKGCTTVRPTTTTTYTIWSIVLGRQSRARIDSEPFTAKVTVRP